MNHTMGIADNVQPTGLLVELGLQKHPDWHGERGCESELTEHVYLVQGTTAAYTKRPLLINQFLGVLVLVNQQPIPTEPQQPS
ncbi:hypothetical protein GA0115261_1010532 [Streptomyces sp. OspMP-M43]|nr:hypothetical protein GA0115261_1010532 [Streptomyces sp. OspMP-M43]